MAKKKVTYELPKTAVIYVRVSSEEQTHGFSLSTQEKACREFCHRNGWDVLKVFKDEGASAKTANRPYLKLMQEFCMKNPGKVGYVVVWKVDRFARNQQDHFELKAYFTLLKIELRSATEAIGSSPMERFSEGVLSAVAQYDNDVRRERTLTGMRAKAIDGYWPVGAPWGYKNDKDKKIIYPDPERAPIVKFIFEEYARGTIKIADLTRKVRTLGAKSKHGLKMGSQLIYKILRNPIHCGRIVIRRWGVEVMGKHDAIISEALFDDVQDLLDGKKNANKVRTRDHPEFPLRGVLCDECGCAISGGFSRGKMGKLYAYYGCRKKGCPKKGSIKKSTLEGAFTAFLKSVTPDDNFLEALAEAISVVYETVERDNVVQNRKFDSELEKLDKQLDGLVDMRLKGMIDDGDYYKQSDRRKATKRELEIERSQLVSTDASVEADIKFGISLLKELPEIWQTLEPGELRVLRSLIFPQNLRYKNQTFQTREISPIYKLKSSSDDDLNRYVTPSGFEPEFSP